MIKILKQQAVDFFLRRSFFIVVTVAILTLLAAAFLPKIKIDNSIDVFFNKKGSSYLDFQEWKKQFGSDEVIIAALNLDKIFTQKNLKLIQRITESFETLDYVDNVTSLTTVNNIIGEDEDLVVERLIEEIPQNKDELEKIKNLAISDPLYLKNIISPDGKTAAFIIELEHRVGDDLYKKEAIESIEDVLKKNLADVSGNKKYYIRLEKLLCS